jgi:predicted nucleotidyltransferase
VNCPFAAACLFEKYFLYTEKGYQMKCKNITLKIFAIVTFVFLVAFENVLLAQDTVPDTALNFDGVDNYVQCGDSGSIGINNQLTIEAWIKVSSSFPAASRVGNIIGKYNHSPNFNFEGHTDGRLRLWWNGGEVDVYATNLDMRDDSWHHVAVTRDSAANQIIFYTDGQINGIFSAGSDADYQWPLRIGGDFRSDPGIPFNGIIEEVRLWNVVRTAHEIRENMYLTLTGSETGLISYWQFNEAAGDTTYDPVSGHDGTLHNIDAADWVISTVPVGGGSSYTQIIEDVGVFDFSGTGLTMDFSAKSGTDTVVVSKLDLAPNLVPPSPSVFDSQYWVVNKFGSGTLTADLTFTPSEVITAEDETSPAGLGLFFRTSRSDSAWTNMMGASVASVSNNTASFDSISTFSQFLIGRRWFNDINAGLIGVRTGSVAWGDYDNDGDLDILITGNIGYYDGSWQYISRIYRNDDGIFSDINANLIPVNFSSVQWGDYDNDGDLDILLAGSVIPRIYRNDVGVFTDINAGLTYLQNSSVAWGDYDNDGDLDILLTSWDRSKIYRNDTGVFSEINTELPGLLAGSVAWGDFDNDSDLDILLSGSTGSYGISKIYRNDAGIFTDINAGLDSVLIGSVAWGDYDNDGDLDILLTGSYISKIYRNDLDPSQSSGHAFTDINAGLPGVTESSVAWGDYDNDGDLDILLTGPARRPLGYISRIYRNNCPVPNRVPIAPDGLTAVVSADSLSFSWNKASDNETAQDGLSYNLVMGNLEYDILMNPPMADINDGYRYIPAFGNACQVTSLVYKISDLYSYPQVIPPDYWGVQTIDHSFAGSAFTTESISFSPVTYLQTINNNIMQPTDLLSWEIQFSDSITSYQVQIDNDSTFLDCEVDDTLLVSISATGYYSIPLQDLSGTDGLVEGSKYYWQVKPNYIFGLPSTFSKPAVTFWFGFVGAIDEKQENAIPKEFALQQNYPNPFNPTTNIEFDLPKALDVRIDVYNIAGQKVKTLLYKQMQAGSHQVEWDALGIASGIYYYRIEAGEFQDVKKMVLLK